MNTTLSLPAYNSPLVSHALVTPAPAPAPVVLSISSGGMGTTVLLASSIALGANMVDGAGKEVLAKR